jgi:hypothetical protein
MDDDERQALRSRRGVQCVRLTNNQ